MDSGPSMIINFFIILVVLLLAILFTLTEYSLVKVRLSALKALQETREKPSRNISNAIYMTTHLTEYLSTAQVGITLTSLILGWIGEETVAEIILGSGIIPAEYAHAVASVAAMIIFTIVHAVFTDLVPKNIAIESPVKVLLFIVRPVRFFHIALFPLIWTLDHLSNGITHLLGFRTDGEEDIYSQTEILSLSKNAAAAGELDEEDLTFMQRAFEMNDKVAVDIMIDRTSMTIIDVTASIADGLNLYLQERYSRFPVVADNDKDKVLGYVFNYDLVRQARIKSSDPVSKIMRDIPAVPENMDLHDVMDEMIIKRSPIAIVVDEYGGTSGLITDKDIYEELFGTVRDEIDDVSDDYIEKLGDHRFKISGKMTLYDFERYFNRNIKELENDDAVTLTGYVLNHDPEFRAGDTMKVANFELTALDYDNAYISQFIVKELPLPKDDLNQNGIFDEDEAASERNSEDEVAAN
ncbi:hemolysin [Leuconostoc mesenteroides subsp. mesenteroides J18]|uniref:hemolysin family protein n=1 Tax=Leuconostoc mesenteroides TaxID=1245 RepID=UPI0002340C91|nr:hemolysin family protein [Leuconostoc mesenteroides]AET29663.1 hemolysin [Leuconostoc mesenteroides subsp. mesenteroides J18]AQU48672.1 hemolysin [Leuconostoc mesenteroides subsp. mesenteroides]QXC54215.1 HlyC/CorC family transporter [Leuconostoc mesenteroides]TGD35838.1 HlyC/CorC family transporter [Leuconostoc mesenteroides]USI46040.1 hemolysin family protein [Leuconostoc mesenteroides]